MVTTFNKADQTDFTFLGQIDWENMIQMIKTFETLVMGIDR